MSKQLLKSTSLVSAGTLTSRLLGFVRDMIAAQIFGVNASVDAFYVAFKIPNFMRNLFAEGSFSQAFVPVLSEYRQKRSHEEVKHLIDHITGSLGSVLLLLTIIGMLAAPVVVMIFAPGLDPYRFHLASYMLCITTPYLMFISLTALCAAILNSYGVFVVPSFTPALLNICLIATAFGVTRFFKIPVEAQAWGVFLAGIVQLGFQLPFLKRLKLLPRPRINWQDEGVRRVLTLMIPAMFGASVGQISILINTIFASFLKVGSVSWLYYAERIAYFPLGVFGVALATVVLPHLSRHHATASKEHFASTLDWGIRCNLLIGLPATVAMLVLAGPLVVTLFQNSNIFTAYDSLMVRQAVIAYGVGLQAFMLMKVLSSAFYARQDLRTPVRYAVITVIINMILNATLIFPFKHAGLALASSLSSWFNTILLAWTLHRREIFKFQRGWLKFISRLVFANGAIALFLGWFSGNMMTWMQWRWYTRYEHVFLLGFGAVGLYLICLWLTGMRLKDFKATI